MKKLLALILALVMVMGLATVGTNAAKVYSDQDDIDYDEAIAVMSEVGVFQGVGDNTFNPGTELKRSEAAKIVAYLLTDAKTADAIEGRGKFNDVASNHWAAGYIEYLDSQGVLTGRGNGNFDPDGQLIAVDFAKMLLVCLGYDAVAEGMVGNDYQIHTSKLAVERELFKGMGNIANSTVLTREQAAQMAFNTIKAPTVRYESKGGSISINGADISFGGSDAVFVTTTIASQQNISNRQLTNSGINNTQSGYTVEFGEKQYPDLKLDKTTDGFGRPVNKWTYGKNNIGQYIDRDSLLETYTTAVTGADLLGVYGEARIANTDKEDFFYYVNGEKIVYAPVATGSTTPTKESLAVGLENMVRNNVTPYFFTGNGVLTEVFLRDEQLYVTSIFTYYAVADADYNTMRGEVRYTLWSYDSDSFGTVAPGTAGITAPLDVDDFPGIEDMKEKEAFLIRLYKDGSSWTPGEIKRNPKTVASEQISEFSVSPSTRASNSFYSGYVKGDSQYSYAKTVYLHNLLRSYDSKDASLKSPYKLVFDWNDEYVIFANAVSASTNYLFLAGLNTSGNNLATTEADGYAIFDTGVGRNIKVNLLDTNNNINKYTSNMNGATYRVVYDTLSTTSHAYNRWFTYTVSGEGASEIYTLEPVVNTQMVSADANSAPYTSTGNSSMGDTGSKVARFSTANTRLVGDYINDYTTAYTSPTNALNTDFSKQTAWFNQNSKIFTVSVDRVNPVLNRAWYPFSISKVTGIYEGIQGTDIAGFPMMTGTEEVEDYGKRNPFAAVAWTVFDAKSQYVKYAVIVGEDAAQTSNYLYAINTPSKEELRSDGYYYWTLDAIVDGELKTVTVKSTYTAGKSVRDAVTGTTGYSPNTNGEGANALYKADFDKDGNVTNLVQVPYYSSASDTYYNNYEKSADVYTSAPDLRQYGDHVVYNTYDSANDTLWATARTLYNKYDQADLNSWADGYGATFMSGTDIGLPIADGAKVYVLQQTLNEATGVLSRDVQSFSNFNTALGYLWASDSNLGRFAQTGSRDTAYQFNGYIAAGIDKSSHLAKWVVIKNLNIINVNNDKTASTQINANVYAVTSPTNTLVFEVNAALTGTAEYEIWGHTNGLDASADTLIGSKGTIALSSANAIAFGNVDASNQGGTMDTQGSAVDAYVTIGLNSNMSYKIIIRIGTAVYQTGYMSPIG